MKKSNVLLAWSGGLDSTALFLRCLYAGHRVTVVSIDLLNNPHGQREREKQARQAILKWVDHHFGIGSYEHIEASIGYGTASMELMGFQQTPAWLNILQACCSTKHNVVYMGYVMGDDAISFLDEIQGVWKAYRKLSVGVLPALQFPLKGVSKKTLWNELDGRDGLRSLVTWCSSDDLPDNCGKCPSCLRMISLGLQPAG